MDPAGSPQGKSVGLNMRLEEELNVLEREIQMLYERTAVVRPAEASDSTKLPQEPPQSTMHQQVLRLSELTRQLHRINEELQL